MLEKIIHNGDLYALIIKSGYKAEGVHFFTPNDYPIQMGYMNRNKGYIIDKHTHSPIIPQAVPELNQEILIMTEGKIKIDLYDTSQQFISSTIIYKGDIIMFLRGGHGFEMLEPSEFFEIKQGPYRGLAEKILF